MKIQIIGASGTGKSTLGNYIAEKEKVKWIDTDCYIWKDETFSENYPIDQRLKMYANDREKYNRFVVSGSVFAWNPTGFNDRDLLVFLTLDDKLRFQRLRQREIERTGESSLWLDIHGNQTNDFLDWCKTYYTANDPSKIGTFAEHTYQMNHSSSPVLKVNSDQSLEELYQTIMRFVIK